MAEQSDNGSKVSSKINKGSDLVWRSEFLFLYDTRMANSNGDPDENRPRIDPYSGKNLVTEYRLKRTIRDFNFITQFIEWI